MATKFEGEGLRFELVEDWQRRPDHLPLEDVAAAATDSAGNVYLYGRGEHPVTIYSRAGQFLGEWGAGRFSPRSHGIFITPADDLYLVDDGINFVGRFSLDGQLRQIVGPAGIRSDTGYRAAAPAVLHAAGPYNSPTNVAVAPWGELYVSDGYRNAAIHRFAADGTLRASWGAPGSGPDQFRIPHGIAIGPDGRVFVADRENDRVQIFSPDGQLLSEWTDIRRPQEIAFDAAGRVYVAELSWFPGEVSGRLGPVAEYLPARLSIFTPAGDLLLRWSDPDSGKPGYFIAPHDVWVDDEGAIYVSEVTEVWAVPRGYASLADHRLQKFVPV